MTTVCKMINDEENLVGELLKNYLTYVNRSIIMKWLNLLQKEIFGRVRPLWKDLESETQI